MVEEKEALTPHSDFDRNKLYAIKKKADCKSLLENLICGQEPIKIKLNEYDATISVQGPYGYPIGVYAYPVPYSQDHYDFKLELKNVLTETWELYHNRFKRFYEV